MTIIRWRPFQEMDNALEIPNKSANGEALSRIGEFATDVLEEKNNVLVKIHVADIHPDKIEIAVEGDSLRISGHREQTSETHGKKYHHKEIRYGSFERVISLPVAVNSDEAKAELEHGVLTVTLPKKIKQKNKKIKVERH